MDTEADETDDESFPLARARPVESDVVARLFHAALCSCFLLRRRSMQDDPGEKMAMRLGLRLERASM